MLRKALGAVLLIPLFLIAGCMGIPKSGPSASQFEASKSDLTEKGIALVDLSPQVVQSLNGSYVDETFSRKFGSAKVPKLVFGPGDVLEITIWESPPAVLFGSGQGSSSQVMIPTGQTVNLPSQQVDTDGYITVPFAGRIKAQGLTANELNAAIVQALAHKANQPQAMVRLAQNQTQYVTLVSEGSGATHVPFTAKAVHLLDVLSTSGGGKQPADKLTVQIVRNGQMVRMPFPSIISDPQQNIPMQSGDVISLLYQPYKLTVLGATGKSEEIALESSVTLVQALARAGGLDDALANPSGVFIFRQQTPALPSDENKNGVIYRLDLSNPANFFLARNFFIEDKDILYVASSPVTDMQKFLNVFFSVVYPLTTTAAAIK